MIISYTDKPENVGGGGGGVAGKCGSVLVKNWLEIISLGIIKKK